MERAKELYLSYCGNHFMMDHDGAGAEYGRYRVSKETEEAWRREYLEQYFAERRFGRAAVNAYRRAVEFLKSDRSDPEWEEILYEPLRAKHVDDVSVMFMLPLSRKLAKKAAERGCYTRQEAKRYLQEMDRCTAGILKRAEEGTQVRSEDYVMLEFSDPAYIAAYVQDLKRAWAEML